MIPKIMLIALCVIAAVSIHPVYGLAPFVDETKDPKSYVDRYHNEPSYKEWFDENYPQYDSIYEAVGLQEPIPVWIKSSALLYGQGEITDNEFFNIIQFLLDRNIVKTPNTGAASDNVGDLQQELSELKANIVRDIQGAYDDGYNNGYSDGLDRNGIVERVPEPEEEPTTEPEEEPTITVKTDSDSYSDGDTITITGNIENHDSGISVDIIVRAPNGNIVSIAQVPPNSNGNFESTITAGGALMRAEGEYTIKIEHGSALSETTFNYIGSQEPTITVKTDSDSYSKGQDVVITGKVTNPHSETPVIIIVKAPDDNLVTISQATPNSNGNFEEIIEYHGQLMKSSGDYKISIHYGGYTAETTINYVGGSPEPRPEPTTEPEIEEESESTIYFLHDSVRSIGQVYVMGTITNYNPSIPMTFTVIAPNGDIVSSEEIYPSTSGGFDITLPIDASWRLTGDYTFVVEHGSDSSEITFNYVPQPESTINIKTDSKSYSKGQTVIVTGKVSNLYYDIPMIITTTAPDGNVVNSQGIGLYSDGSFRTTYIISDSWKLAGDYTVVAQYGSASSDEITFNIPEPINVEIDSKSYSKGQKITVTGNIENYGSSGTWWTVYTDTYRVMGSETIYPNSDGTFEVIIDPDGLLWEPSYPRDYKISIHYGGYTAETTFSYVPGPEPTINVEIDSESYDDGDTITITGNIENYDSEKVLTFQVISPDNNIVTVGNITPNSNGNFETTSNVGGSLWQSSGDYIIKIEHGSTSSEATFNYIGSQIITNDEVIIETAIGSSIPGCEETDECFIPSVVRVDVGDVIIFTNPDTAAHTYTSGNPQDVPDGVFDSSLVVSGASYEWIPTTVGKQPYFCMVHPWMKGTIIVS